MKICNFMKNFYFPTIMTVTHISQFCQGIERRVLGVMKTWDRGQKENNFSELASAKLALSIVLSPLLLSGFALFCYAMISYPVLHVPRQAPKVSNIWRGILA